MLRPTNEIREAFRPVKIGKPSILGRTGGIVAGWKCTTVNGRAIIVSENDRSIPGHMHDGQMFDWSNPSVMHMFMEITGEMLKSVQVVADISKHEGKRVIA